MYLLVCASVQVGHHTGPRLIFPPVSCAAAVTVVPGPAHVLVQAKRRAGGDVVHSAADRGAPSPPRDQEEAAAAPLQAALRRVRDLARVQEG